MAYAKPPFVTTGTVVSVVGTATATLLSPASVGFAYRIVGGQIGVNRSSAGTSDMHLVGSISGTIFVMDWGLIGSGGGTNTIPIVIPEPGIQLLEEEGVNLQIVSNFAGITGRCVLYWFNDGK